MSITSEIVPLFSTPVVVSDVPDAAALNAELRKVIEQRHKTHPGTQHSNLGGWQSSWDMDRWGGAPAIKLLAIGRNLANRSAIVKHESRHNAPWVNDSIGVRMLLPFAEINLDDRCGQPFFSEENAHAT